MCDSFRWAIRMAAGREARHCHPGGREGTAGVWQGWGHTARQDRDRTGTSPSPRGEPCAGAQAGTALGHGGLCTPWDPAEAARAPHGWLWSCSPPGHPTHQAGTSPAPAGREGSLALPHQALPPSSPPQAHPGEAALPLHCPTSPPGALQDSEAHPTSIFPQKIPSFPLPGAERSLGQLWAAGKSIPAELCPWD